MARIVPRSGHLQICDFGIHGRINKALDVVKQKHGPAPTASGSLHWIGSRACLPYRQAGDKKKGAEQKKDAGRASK
jgi:hypothetical protein